MMYPTPWTKRYFGRVKRGSSSSFSDTDTGSGGGGCDSSDTASGSGGASASGSGGGATSSGSGSESSFFARAFSLALSAMTILAFSRAWVSTRSRFGTHSRMSMKTERKFQRDAFNERFENERYERKAFQPGRSRTSGCSMITCSTSAKLKRTISWLSFGRCCL